MVHAEFALTLLNFAMFRNSENLGEFGNFQNFLMRNFLKLKLEEFKMTCGVCILNRISVFVGHYDRK